MKNYLTLVAIATTLAFASSAQAQSNDFDQVTDTAGMNTDRYAPATLEAGATGGGRTGVLKIGVDAADGSNNRPPGYSGLFYDTQGVNFLLDPGMTKMSIELYIPAVDWTSDTTARHFGLWAQTDTGAFGVLEYGKQSTVDGYRGWESSGNWFGMGTPSGFAYGTWNTLQLELLTGIDKIRYTVNGELALDVAAYGGTSFTTAYLQVHQSNPNGVTYNAYADNFEATTGAIPEPATWALMIGGFGLAGTALRRRRTAIAA